MNPLSYLASEPVIQVSWGAGMIRVWHKTKGLLLELPNIVAVQSQTRTPLAWFEEAAALEGKTAEGVECIRPWWSDAVTDRVALRGLAGQFRRRLLEVVDQDQTRQWKDRKDTWQVGWVVAPSTSELHRQWLERTLGESGWWWPQVKRSNWSAVVAQSNQAVVMDWGASALRWSIWVRGSMIASYVDSSLSLTEVAAELVSVEQSVTTRRFSRAALMDLNWSLRHPAFDHKYQKPVFEPLSKTTLAKVHAAWSEAYSQSWRKFQDQLPAESAAQLAVSPGFVIGGGAALKPWVQSTQEISNIDWQVPKDPLYIEVRSGTE